MIRTDIPRALILVLCLALAGCFGPRAPEPLPARGAQVDGSWAVSCDGNDVDWGACYREAESHCGGPYTVLRSLTRAENGMTVRALVVRCEKAGGGVRP